MESVSLADAKARLSELVERVAAGGAFEITRRGRPIARLSAAAAARRPIDLACLQRLTETMPPHDQDAGAFLRSVRDDARY